MKILHLSHAMVWGGNEQQLIDLIAELENLNTYNTIFCFEESAINKYCLKNKVNRTAIIFFILKYKKLTGYMLFSDKDPK